MPATIVGDVVTQHVTQPVEAQPESNAEIGMVGTIPGPIASEVIVQGADALDVGGRSVVDPDADPDSLALRFYFCAEARKAS